MLPGRLVVLVLAVLPGPLFSQAAGGTLKPTPVSTKINDILGPIREKHKLPALAAAIVDSKGLVAVGAVGVRKRGTDVAVTVDDQFHLGSDTKAFTATLIGQLVEKGQLHWDDTLGKVFPKQAEAMPAPFRNITLTELLTHHAGLPADLAGGWGRVPRKGTTRAQRLVALEKAMTEKLDSKPGEKFGYSNLGYVLATAMAEQAADDTWEGLLKKRVFEPLEMTSAGFGPMGTAGKLDQPWQHRTGGEPVRPGPFADNPPVMGPAGTIHCSLPDWARFVADQLHGARGCKGLLQVKTYEKLHSSPFQDEFYTRGGWGGGEHIRRAGGLVLTHDGSNTQNYCTAWLAPQRDFAVLVATNQGGDAAEKACIEARKALIAQFMK